MHIEEKSRESLERPGTKKKKSGPAQSSNKVKKRRFKPLKRDELKAKKEETKKRVMTRAKEATKTITTDVPNKNNNNNHVHVGELEVVAIEAPEDIINEIYGDSDAEEIEKKSVEKVEKPEWFDKERKLSVSLALAASNMLLCSCLTSFFLFTIPLLSFTEFELSIVQVPLIDADGSALPLSIIPHGVPLKRGFPAVQVVIHVIFLVIDPV